MNLTIIQDTREQNGYSPLFRSRCVVTGLEIGDYSVCGLEELIAVERKTLADLISSISTGRERFERELRRARTLHRFYVVVEASADDIIAGNYERSKMHPNAAFATVMSWTTKYCPFIYAGNRETAARLTEEILHQYAERFRKVVKLMDKQATMATARKMGGS